MLLIPNLDLSEKIGNAVIKKTKFWPFFATQFSNFRLKQCEGP